MTGLKAKLAASLEPRGGGIGGDLPRATELRGQPRHAHPEKRAVIRWSRGGTTNPAFGTMISVRHPANSLNAVPAPCPCVHAPPG